MRPPPSLLRSLPRASCSSSFSSSTLPRSSRLLLFRAHLLGSFPSLLAELTRPPLLIFNSLLLAVLRLPLRPLHVSSPTLESEFKRKMRLSKKKSLAASKNILEDWYNTAPDPFLGMQLVVSKRALALSLGWDEGQSSPPSRKGEVELTSVSFLPLAPLSPCSTPMGSQSTSSDGVKQNSQQPSSTQTRSGQQALTHQRTSSPSFQTDHPPPLPLLTQ